MAFSDRVKRIFKGMGVGSGLGAIACLAATVIFPLAGIMLWVAWGAAVIGGAAAGAAAGEMYNQRASAVSADDSVYKNNKTVEDFADGIDREEGDEDKNIDTAEDAEEEINNIAFKFERSIKEETDESTIKMSMKKNLNQIDSIVIDSIVKKFKLPPKEINIAKRKIIKCAKERLKIVKQERLLSTLKNFRNICFLEVKKFIDEKDRVRESVTDEYLTDIAKKLESERDSFIMKLKKFGYSDSQYISQIDTFYGEAVEKINTAREVVFKKSSTSLVELQLKNFQEFNPVVEEKEQVWSPYDSVETKKTPGPTEKNLQIAINHVNSQAAKIKNSITDIFKRGNSRVAMNEMPAYQQAVTKLSEIQQKKLEPLQAELRQLTAPTLIKEIPENLLKIVKNFKIAVSDEIAGFTLEPLKFIKSQLKPGAVLKLHDSHLLQNDFINVEKIIHEQMELAMGKISELQEKIEPSENTDKLFEQAIEDLEKAGDNILSSYKQVKNLINVFNKKCLQSKPEPIAEMEQRITALQIDAKVVREKITKLGVGCGVYFPFLRKGLDRMEREFVEFYKDHIKFLISERIEALLHGFNQDCQRIAKSKLTDPLEIVESIDKIEKAKEEILSIISGLGEKYTALTTHGVETLTCDKAKSNLNSMATSFLSELNKKFQAEVLIKTFSGIVEELAREREPILAINKAFTQYMGDLRVIFANGSNTALFKDYCSCLMGVAEKAYDNLCPQSRNRNMSTSSAILWTKRTTSCSSDVQIPRSISTVGTHITSR